MADQRQGQGHQGQGHQGDPGHQGQGQGQAHAPGQQPDAQPKSDQQKLQEQQAENRRYYDEQIEKMTNRNVFDRVRAAHPHAMNSREATDTMVKDYERLVEEGKRASGDPSRPVGTTG